MNEIEIRSDNIPANAEDLSKFVLIGRDRLTAVRAAIRAIDKVGLAAEVYQQKLAEGQEIAEAVLDAEVRLGELRKSVERKPRIENLKTSRSNNVVTSETPVQEFDRKTHLNKMNASRLESMASHPDIVQQVKQQAREAGELVTRKAVLEAIKKEKDKPHVSYNSGNNEWYTPAEYIEAAREVMGSIDLDPASSDIANKVVKAGKYYTAKTDGLAQRWFGNIWLNPPYAVDLIGKFAEALANKRSDYRQAVVLVNNATETHWFACLVGIASAIIFPTSRIKFYMADGKTGSPLQGQAFLYIGNNPNKFLEVFSRFGWGMKSWKKKEAESSTGTERNR